MTPTSNFDPPLALRRWRRKPGIVPVLAGLAMMQATARAVAEPAEAALVSVLREEAAGYEHGSGVAKDVPHAVVLYCRAARLGDAESQFNLGWIYANGRGVSRDDATAAFFFAAAAEQGVEQARLMLRVVGAPAAQTPECMRGPHPSAAKPGPAPPSSPIRSRTGAPKRLVQLVTQLAPDYRVEPRLVLAIMEVESNFDSAALSPRRAMGLMQLVPDTAARFKVQDAYDPKQNIRGGLSYLRWLLAYFEGDLTLVAAAYNAGEGTVERYGGVPPYAETRSYVRRVIAMVGSRAHPFDASITPPSPQLRALRGAGTQD